jgi:phage-related protein
VPREPSVVVKILGDIKNLAQSFEGASGKANTSGQKIGDTYKTVFGQINQTGVLGPLGDQIDQAGQSFEKASGHVKTLGRTMMGVGAAVGVAGGYLTEVGSKEQASQQQLQNAVENTGTSYEKVAGKVEAAGKSQERFGHTTVDTNNALAKLTEATNSPTKALSLLSVTSDLAASKHISLEAAASKIGKAYNGNTRILKEYGIEVQKTTNVHTALTKATTTAEKADASLAASKQKLGDVEASLAGKTKLTTAEQLKLRDAHDKVTAATIVAYTGHVNLAKAQDGVKQAAQGNSKAMDELGAKLKGQAAAASDTYGGKVKALQVRIEDTAAKIGEKFGPAITATGAVLTTAGGAVEGFNSLVHAAGKAQDVATKAGKAATDATKLQAAAQWLLNIAMDAFPIVLIVLGIAALVAAFILLYKHSKLVRDIVADVGKFFTTAFKDILKVAKDAITWVADHWKLLAAGLLVILGPIGIVVAAFLLFHKQILAIIKDVVKVFTDLPGELQAVFKDALTWLEQAGKDIVNGLWNGVKAIWTLLDAAWHSWVQGVKDIFKDAGSWLVGAGSAIVNGLWSGLTGAWNAVSGWLGGMGGRVIGAIGAAGSWLLGTGGAVISGLYNGITGAIGSVTGWVGGIGGKISGAIGDLGSTLTGAGTAVIGGLLSGITSKFEDVKNFVGGIAGKIASLKGPLPKDVTLLVPHGQAIMAGLNTGLLRGWPGVESTLRSITGAIGGATVPGLSVSSGSTSAGSTIAGPGRSAPAVHIETAVFTSEVDVEAFMKRAAWVAKTARV